MRERDSLNFASLGPNPFSGIKRTPEGRPDLARLRTCVGDIRRGKNAYCAAVRKMDKVCNPHAPQTELLFALNSDGIPLVSIMAGHSSRYRGGVVNFNDGPPSAVDEGQLLRGGRLSVKEESIAWPDVLAGSR